jgi:hypothetical protein
MAAALLSILWGFRLHGAVSAIEEALMRGPVPPGRASPRPEETVIQSPARYSYLTLCLLYHCVLSLRSSPSPQRRPPPRPPVPPPPEDEAAPEEGNFATLSLSPSLSSLSLYLLSWFVPVRVLSRVRRGSAAGEDCEGDPPDGDHLRPLPREARHGTLRLFSLSLFFWRMCM